MSFVVTQPEMLSAAATDLRAVGTAMTAGNAAAAGPTTGVVPAAADEVSALTATQFAAHAAMYQAVGALAAQLQALLATALDSSAGAYAATETANAVAVG